MKRTMRKTGPFTVLWMMVLILLAATIFSGGCVNKILQKNTENAQAVTDSSQNISGMNIIPDITPGSFHQASFVEITPAKSEIVTEVSPFLTPDPYPIIHGTRINATPVENPLYRIPEFEKNYPLRGNTSGLLVNVVEPPLYIVYEVTPQYDCLENPESCRGNLNASVNLPYMTITVRDNQSHEIVAEDGFGRIYSSDTGRYEISITALDSAGKTITTTSYPGPRYIKIYKGGVYDVTIEGNFLDVKVRILTGTSPSRLAVGNGDTSSQAEPSPEDEWG